MLGFHLIVSLKKITAFKNSKIDSAVSLLTQRCQWHRWVLTQRCQLHLWVLTQRCQLHRWVLTQRCQLHRWVMVLVHIQKLIFIDSAVSMTLPSFDSAVSSAIWNSNIFANWLVFSKLFLGVSQRPRERCLMKKTGVQKSRETRKKVISAAGTIMWLIAKICPMFPL